MLQHQARLWNLLHTNALISTCQRHVPYASHSTTIQYAHACHAMQLDVYYRWLKIVTQIDIATCLWARYILMINSIPSAQMQTTHATCDMRHATVMWDMQCDGMLIRCDCDMRQVTPATWSNHECGIDGGGMRARTSFCKAMAAARLTVAARGPSGFTSNPATDAWCSP